jgi:hypothetical protein
MSRTERVTFPKDIRHTKGLKLSNGEIITVGRIVNDDWYQGFKDVNTCGYFPRVFVRVQRCCEIADTTPFLLIQMVARILDAQYREEFGQDAPTEDFDCHRGWFRH